MESKLLLSTKKPEATNLKSPQKPQLKTRGLKILNRPLPGRVDLRSPGITESCETAIGAAKQGQNHLIRFRA